MKSLSNFITEELQAITEAELSELQKKYQSFFKDLLSEFDVKSPGELEEAKKKEFFSKIKSSWPSAKNESINEAKEPKHWDSGFSMKVLKAFSNKEFDIKDASSVAKWDKEYNGGIVPKPALSTVEIVKHAMKVGKFPNGDKFNESVNEAKDKFAKGNSVTVLSKKKKPLFKGEVTNVQKDGNVEVSYVSGDHEPSSVTVYSPSELVLEAELSAKQKEYQEFFKDKLKKFDVSSPSELDDDKKKEFFNSIEKDWDAVDEAVNEGNAEKIQAEIDKWEGRLYTMTDMKSSSNSSDDAKQKKTIESTKKKIESLKNKLEKNKK